MAQQKRALKLLVANRGEIACRIFQACREMGIQTVGVFTPEDEQARHVTFADELYQVPSYLDIPSLLKVALESKTNLIHPGYGFLSERPQFVEAVEKNGILFVGPRAETMHTLGDKTGAKILANQIQVPTLQWAKIQPGSDLKAIAQSIGYPILLKASAGGGGKGMRKVTRAENLASAAEGAATEAESAFGDGTLFIEKLIESPRHIEVQVFGDGHGGGIHLYDRECTLQRRHQKIWEEALAPDLTSTQRERLYESALKLVTETSYRNAGTVEFLLDSQGGFYFLEMNTRLQVEHPVTEWVTGIDLVRAQIQQTLEPGHPTLKATPPHRGHAIEVRLYAEDPSQEFVPTPGLIEKIAWPSGPGIRVDCGIEESQTIHTNYDSMLGKLSVFAETREFALARLRVALDETVILGIGSNQNYLRSLLEHQKVQEGKVDTGFLEREFSDFFEKQMNLSEKEIEMIATYSKQAKRSSRRPSQAGEIPSPWHQSNLKYV